MEDGISVRQKPKQTASVKPFVSVVTVTYNAREVLERTIKSVVNQTLRNREYIIVDGGSSDGTLEIIKKYEHLIDYWVSEKDSGIYDAMNKGIACASGEWINFMNAGDVFFDDNVLQNIFDQEKDYSAKIIYGHAMKSFAGNQNVLSKSRELSAIKCEPPFIHQCVFTDLALAQQYPFNLHYNICADYDFFYKSYLEGIPFQRIDQIVANYDMSGISSNFLQTYKEIRAIQLTYGSKGAPCISRYRLFVIAVKEFVKKILPVQLTESIRIILARKRR